ncbi:MAG: FTR1 family protein [Chloroflexi bacterium]|nr:FTR1 family protein [Chloroflexota bacterium]
MLPSILLSLREGMEAALMIGIILSALHKTQRDDLRPSVGAGAVAAFIFSALAAVGLDLLGAELEGQSELIFEGLSMLLAAALLTWMIFWMGNQSRALKTALENRVQNALRNAGGPALFLLVFVTVVREGIELAVYLYATRLTSGAALTLSGAAVGLISAGLLGWLVFSSARRLNLRQFFQVTNLLLMFFGAGLVAQGVGALSTAGWIPAMIAHLWNTNSLLSDQSLPGQVMKTLFGYDGSPSLIEAISYVVYFASLGLVFRILRLRGSSQTETA